MTEEQTYNLIKACRNARDQFFIAHLELRESVDKTVEAIFLFYQTEKNKRSECVPLLIDKMVTVRNASEKDIRDIYLLEKSVEGRKSASEVELYDRLNLFPEGFFVAVSEQDHVLGYTQSCSWNCSDYTTFENLSDLRSRHDANGDFLYIIFLCVSEPFRRQGIGRKLLQAEIDLAQKKGMKEIHAVSKSDTIGLYEGLGFVNNKVLPSFHDGITGNLMKKDLSSKIS